MKTILTPSQLTKKAETVIRLITREEIKGFDCIESAKKHITKHNVENVVYVRNQFNVLFINN